MARKRASTKPSKRSRAAEDRFVNRLAAGVDPAARAANILQLHRARGQVDGVERMIEEDRYCADIILQITAARASLQVVASALLEAHLKACHRAAMNSGGAAADQMYQELVGLVSKMSK
jgi:DNA-binding FrmR family transcriptional regulator